METCNSEIEIRPEVTETASISDSLDLVLNLARAVRLQKREIQVKVKAFLSALGAGELDDDVEAAEVVFQNYHGDLIKLKEVVKKSGPTVDLNECLNGVNNLILTLEENFEKWRENLKNISGEPCPIPAPAITQSRKCSSSAVVQPQLPEIEPCDSVSNCGSKTRVSKSSSASTRLSLVEIEFELEKKRLEFELNMKQNLARFNFEMAQLEARKRHFSVSYPASQLDRSGTQSTKLSDSVPELLTGRQIGNSVSTVDHSLPELAYRTEEAKSNNLKPQLVAVEHALHTRHNELLRNSGGTEIAFSRHNTPAGMPQIGGQQRKQPPKLLPEGPVVNNSAQLSHSGDHSRPDCTLQGAHQNQAQQITASCPPAAQSQPSYASAGQSYPAPFQHFPSSSHSSYQSMQNAQAYQLLLEEAREIRYKGRDLPFIFYYNQINSLLKRCLDPNKKMDLLRASCQDEARQAISAMVPPVPGWDIDTQVREALNALRLRYGCTSFLSEPLVKQVRSGPKLTRIDTPTLEKLISELNNCELYARAHKQTHCLDSSFILDIGERCPYYFRNRYTDFLLDHYDNPDQPSFESFKLFLHRELKRINTTFAQRFLGTSNDKLDKNRPFAKIRVHQANVGVGPSAYRAPLNVPKPNQLQSPVAAKQTKALPICFVCSSKNSENRHFLFNCGVYQNWNPERRRDELIKARRCLNCYQPHPVKDCKLLCKCKHCGSAHSQKHATSIHDLYSTSGESRKNVGAAMNSTANARGNHGAASVTTTPRVSDPSTDAYVDKVEVKQTGIFARISAVRVSNPQTGACALVYTQHDPGSQVTLMSSALVNELGLVPVGNSVLSLHTLSCSETRAFDRVSFDLEALDTHERFCDRKALVISPWSDEGYLLPHQQALSNYSHFDSGTTHAIPNRSHVDILLGLDNSLLMQVLEERVGSEGEPHAIKTPIGWIASGGSFNEKTSTYVAQRVNAVSCTREIETIANLKETIRNLSVEDEVTQPSINDSMTQRFVEQEARVIGGRYEMPVPLKECIKTLPNNYGLAAKRVAVLRQSMLKRPQLREALLNSMQELKKHEYILPVADAELLCKPVNYLPYFLTNQNKPRVVYDGSAAWKGRCINDSIHSGPDLLNKLSHVLARFRVGKYALMADLSKCFFQILLPRDQRDLFRILWFSNDGIERAKLQSYHFTRHVWGIISSPFIACYAIHRLSLDNPTNASDVAINTMRKSMYMDDLLYSTDTLDDAQSIAFELTDLFASRGFQLVKWTANRPATAALALMSEEKLAPSIRTIDLNSGHETLPNFKAVGCIWNAEQDVLKIQFSFEQPSHFTRRTLLSQIGKQYDPLGFTAPLLLKARLILQQLAMEEISWDEPLNDQYIQAWKDWLCILEKWRDISLSRWYFANATETEFGAGNATYELHAFSDASSEAYGSVVYLHRVVDGISCVSFVFGKSRIVLRSQQNWAIARKELVAAVTSVELMKSASDALQLPKCTQHFWCDSKVVLQWILNPDLRLPKFVARRIDVINRLSRPNQWKYCATDNNPADVATRPMTASTSSTRMQLWLKVPVEIKTDTSFVLVREARVTTALSNGTVSKTRGTLYQMIEAAPNWYILKKRVAYLTAFTEYLLKRKRRERFEKPKLDGPYLERAMERLIIYTQMDHFQKVIEAMRTSSPDCFEDTVRKLVKNASGKKQKILRDFLTLRCLRPCIHSDGTLRIEGRLENADLPTDEKHPIILPSRHPLTRLLVLHCHLASAHSGVQYTLMLTRKKYWIIKGLSSVRHYLARCNACIIQKARPIRQLMADLPTARLAGHTKAFYNTGCDYFGYMLFREGRSERKAWGLLFTCMTTRAIHVELVTSLEVSSFIMAFTRFIDIRGPVSCLYSDNGSTFKAAASILPGLLESEGLQSFFRKKGLSWEFIPPYSPSQGGAWESMIKVFKRTLTHIANLSQKMPSFVELQTYISNATRLVNDRPLTPLSDDPKDYTAISPSSLLTPAFHPNTPVGKPHNKDELRRDYRFNVALAHRFWERWVKFYLPLLQRRKK